MSSTHILGMLLAVACRSPRTPDKAECDTPSGGISNADYEFKSANFSCETSPVDAEFDLNSGSFASYASLSASDIIADYELAADEWSNAGADLAIEVGNTALSGGDVDDDYDFETWMVDDHDPYEDGYDSLAISTQWSYDGEAFDCDVRFYSKKSDDSAIDWVANTSVSAGEYHLAHNFVHELGHCIGIEDQNAASTTSSVMYGFYFAGTEYSALDDDDVEAVVYLYGADE